MPDGNDAQVRLIADSVADAAIVRFASQHPEIRKTEIPEPLKWASAIIAALFAGGVATLVFWLVTSVSEMQVTLARMDERMASGTVKDARYDDIDRRVTTLESYLQENRK